MNDNSTLYNQFQSYLLNTAGMPSKGSLLLTSASLLQHSQQPPSLHLTSNNITAINIFNTTSKVSHCLVTLITTHNRSAFTCHLCLHTSVSCDVEGSPMFLEICWCPRRSSLPSHEHQVTRHVITCFFSTLGCVELNSPQWGDQRLSISIENLLPRAGYNLCDETLNTLTDRSCTLLNKVEVQWVTIPRLTLSIGSDMNHHDQSLW